MILEAQTTAGLCQKLTLACHWSKVNPVECPVEARRMVPHLACEDHATGQVLRLMPVQGTMNYHSGHNPIASKRQESDVAGMGLCGPAFAEISGLIGFKIASLGR